MIAEGDAFERACSQLEDRFQGRAFATSFELADVCTVIPALKAQFFLRYLPCFAQPLQGQSECFFNGQRHPPEFFWLPYVDLACIMM